MDKEPRTFTALTAGQLTSDTQVYTQVPGGAVSDGDYRFTLSQLATLLDSLGFVRPFSDTPYADDAAAIAAGGSSGEWYFLTTGNNEGVPVGSGGILKQIQ